MKMRLDSLVWKLIILSMLLFLELQLMLSLGGGVREAYVDFNGDFVVVCTLGTGVSHPSLDNLPLSFYGVQMKKVCCPIKHSDPMLDTPGPGTVW